MSIQTGFTAFTKEREEVANGAAGIYTVSPSVNFALVTNDSGQKAYVLLFHDVSQNGQPGGYNRWSAVAATNSVSDAGLRLANSDPLGPSEVTALASLTVGKEYWLEFTLAEFSGGGIRIKAGSGTGTYRTANGTYGEAVTCATDGRISFSTNGASSGLITNVRAYQIGSDATNEYDLIIPAAGTVDITYDGRFPVRGFSVDVPTSATVAKINARGRMIPNRNKLAVL